MLRRLRMTRFLRLQGQASTNMHSFVFRVCLLLGWFLVATDSRSLQTRTSDEGIHQSDIFKAFEMKFLNMMGLKRKPRIRRDTVMPQYMLDLYNSDVKDTNYVTTNLVFKDFATTANTVRAIYHTDVRDDHGGTSNSSKKHVTLDITAVPSHEHLVKAEFRIYRNASEKLDMQYPRHIISVYQILQPGVAGKKSVKRLLDSRVVDATSDAGWDSYDIFKAVHDWREKPAENHGLEVDIMSENGNPIDISHLRFEKPEDLEEMMWPHHRPLLAVYTRDPKTHYHKERVRRSSNNHNDAGRIGLCKRRELIVTSSQLKWDKWLISPSEYHAYMCQGDCVYPLAEHMNGTNHAIVQTLVHSVQKYKDTVPAACCVPTEFDSLRMLFLDEHSSPTLKTYKEMIVTACGCR